METALAPERLARMTSPDLQERLDALDRRRREARPKITIERLLTHANFSGIQTWYDTLAGKRPIETVERFEEALDDLIAHPGDNAAEPMHILRSEQSDLITAEVPGFFGTSVVFRGSGANPEAVARAAAEFLRELHAKDEATEEQDDPKSQDPDQSED